MAGSSTLPAIFTGVLEDAIEAFMRLDPRSGELLEPLAGKIIALQVNPFDSRLYLLPSATGFQVCDHLEEVPDATFTGTLLGFARMALSAEPKSELFAGTIAIEGDANTAKRFQDLFKQLQVDWQGQLAKLTGQTAASGVFDVMHGLRERAGEALATLQLNVAEYLQEESRELPAVAEADYFCREVDRLRADADRLEARLDRLQAQAPARQDALPTEASCD